MLNGQLITRNRHRDQLLISAGAGAAIVIRRQIDCPIVEVDGECDDTGDEEKKQSQGIQSNNLPVQRTCRLTSTVRMENGSTSNSEHRCASQSLVKELST